MYPNYSDHVSALLSVLDRRKANGTLAVKHQAGHFDQILVLRQPNFIKLNVIYSEFDEFLIR